MKEGGLDVNERSAKLKARWVIGKYYEFPLKRELKRNKRLIRRRMRGVLKREMNGGEVDDGN